MFFVFGQAWVITLYKALLYSPNYNALYLVYATSYTLSYNYFVSSMIQSTHLYSNHYASCIFLRTARTRTLIQTQILLPLIFILSIYPSSLPGMYKHTKPFVIVTQASPQYNKLVQSVNGY